jgi:hypothetical protein
MAKEDQIRPPATLVDHLQDVGLASGSFLPRDEMKKDLQLIRTRLVARFLSTLQPSFKHNDRVGLAGLEDLRSQRRQLAPHGLRGVPQKVAVHMGASGEVFAPARN